MEEPHKQDTFIDLFAGLGGFRLGMTANNFIPVFGSDINENAAENYRENFQEDILSDITTVQSDTIPSFNILCGGFPCQPFSKAGKGLGFEDTRGTLFFHILRILEDHRPEVVFLENVKNLTSHDGGNTFRTIIQHLEDLGYTTSWAILNGSNYGVPQSRERIIIIGHRPKDETLPGTKFDFTAVPTQPRRRIKDILQTDISHDWLDAEKYNLNSPEQTRTSPTTGLIFAGHIIATMRTNGVRENTSHLSRAHRQANRIYSDEGTHPTLSSQEMSGRFWIKTSKPDGTIGVRKLTLTEAYRLFGFPDSYQRVGSISNQYARIGNSIIIPMVVAIGAEIRKQLLHSEPSTNR